MLNFDEERFLRIQSGAVSLRARLDQVIADCLAAGAENIHFLGTGGAAILMQPAAQLLQRRSTDTSQHRSTTTHNTHIRWSLNQILTPEQTLISW